MKSFIFIVEMQLILCKDTNKYGSSDISSDATVMQGIES